MAYVTGFLTVVAVLLGVLIFGVPLTLAGICTSTGYFCDSSRAVYKRLSTGEAFVPPPPPGYKWATQTAFCSQRDEKSVTRLSDGKAQCYKSP